MTELATRRLTTGRLCLELVATVHGRLGGAPNDDLRDSDLRDGDLQDGERVADWLRSVGIETAERPVGEDLAHYLDVREAVFRLVTAAATGIAPDTEQRSADVALVNAWARGPAPVPQLRVGDYGLLSDTAKPTPRQVLTAVARDTIDLLSTPESGRLHQCDGNHCGTVFLDTSRGGRRRWCSSDTCGNRARVAAHRDRHP
jgi:predicted RNA-binding Zn ribbon-like protein